MCNFIIRFLGFPFEYQRCRFPMISIGTVSFGFISLLNNSRIEIQLKWHFSSFAAHGTQFVCRRCDVQYVCVILPIQPNRPMTAKKNVLEKTNSEFVRFGSVSCVCAKTNNEQLHRVSHTTNRFRILIIQKMELNVCIKNCFDSNRSVSCCLLSPLCCYFFLYLLLVSSLDFYFYFGMSNMISVFGQKVFHVYFHNVHRCYPLIMSYCLITAKMLLCLRMIAIKFSFHSFSRDIGIVNAILVSATRPN